MKAERRRPLIAEVDLPFFRNSGGGVTLSGGEPTVYPVFARRLLPHLDAVYYDLKLADPSAHLRYTGRDNRLILDNLRRLVDCAAGRRGTPSTGLRLLVRVRLVPGITAIRENLEGIAGLLRELGLGRVALLPYNPLRLSKAEGLGQAPAYGRAEWMTPAEERECAEADFRS